MSEQATNNEDNSAVIQAIQELSTRLDTIQSSIQSKIDNLSSSVQSNHTTVAEKLESITSVSFAEMARQIDQLNDDISAKLSATQANMATLTSVNEVVSALQELKGTETQHLDTFRELTLTLSNQVTTVTDNYVTVIQLLNDQVNALNKLIGSLTSTTDAYMSAIGEFKDSAVAAQDITSALLDAQSNLSASITQVYNKVSELRSGLEKLTELSINFTNALDRKFTAVDISEIIKNVGLSLAATKFTLNKEEEKL